MEVYEYLASALEFVRHTVVLHLGFMTKYTWVMIVGGNRPRLLYDIKA